jgi:NAD(P)-dependent dehydrogenase (short-subunit alcohol dehydrogenase family)
VVGAELASEGILVNTVAPSIMDTPANRKDMPDADFASWPKVEEVAATILFLASPENVVTRGAVEADSRGGEAHPIRIRAIASSQRNSLNR